MRTHVACINVVMHGGQRMTLHMEARIYEPANQGPANRATHGGQRITLHMLQGELAQCCSHMHVSSELATHNLLQWISMRLHACIFFFALHCHSSSNTPATFSTPPPQHHQVQSTRVPGCRGLFVASAFSHRRYTSARCLTHIVLH